MDTTLDPAAVPTLEEFTARNPTADPLRNLQDYRDTLKMDLLRKGEFDDGLSNEIDSQLFQHAQESGMDLGDDPVKAFTSRDSDSDLELVARYSQDEAIRAAARTHKALKDPYVRDLYEGNESEYTSKLDAAKLTADSLLTPTVRDAARKAALQSGELPFASFKNPDGSERLDISPAMKEFAGNDAGLAALFEANPQLDRSRIGEIRAKLQTPDGYSVPAFEIDRQSEFISALGTIAGQDADVAGKLASLRDAVDTGSEGNLQPFIDQIDTQLANHGLHADGSTAQERQAFIRDYLMANAAPAADFENVDANVRTLSTGQAVIPMAVLMNKPLFEKTMAESTRIPAAQKEQMAAMRESQISAAAPESFKIIAANRSDFTPFFDQKKAAGASNAEILDEWMANPENYSSFRSYAGGVGESVIEGFGGLLLYPAAMMGSDSARRGLASLQQSDAERRAYASLFGKNLGVGYDVARLVAPVAADVGVSILTGGAAAGFVGAKTGFRSALRATLAASLSAETKSLARSFTVRAAGGAAKTAGMSADQVLTAAGRDMAQKFTTSATTASFLATAFNRSAGATYVQLFSTLEGQKNPDGTPKYTPEKVREIALHHGLVAGAITASVTGAFSFLGRGGLESIYSGMSRKQLDGVFNRLKTDWSKMAPSVREGVDMASADAMLESVIRKSITPFFKTLGNGFIDEAGEEGIDQVLGYVNQQMATGEKFSIDDAVRQGAYAALLGGIMGGGVVGIREVGSSADVSANSEALTRRDALLSTARKLDATSPRTAAAVRELAMSGIPVGETAEETVPPGDAAAGNESAPGEPPVAAPPIASPVTTTTPPWGGGPTTTAHPADKPLNLYFVTDPSGLRRSILAGSEQEAVSQSGSATATAKLASVDPKSDSVNGARGVVRLTDLASQEGVDLTKMSRDQYVDFAVKHGVYLDGDAIRAQPSLRVQTDVATAHEAKNMKSQQASTSGKDRSAFQKVADGFFKLRDQVIDLAGVPSGQVRTLDHAQGWINFKIKGDPSKARVQSNETHKAYVNFGDNFQEALTEDNVKSLLQALHAAKFNGQMKFGENSTQMERLADQLVLHGESAADTQIASDVVNKFFEKSGLIEDTNVGVDDKSKGGSYTEILSARTKAASVSQQAAATTLAQTTTTTVTTPEAAADPAATEVPAETNDEINARHEERKALIAQHMSKNPGQTWKPGTPREIKDEHAENTALEAQGAPESGSPELPVEAATGEGPAGEVVRTPEREPSQSDAGNLTDDELRAAQAQEGATREDGIRARLDANKEALATASKRLRRFKPGSKGHTEMVQQIADLKVESDAIAAEWNDGTWRQRSPFYAEEQRRVQMNRAKPVKVFYEERNPLGSPNRGGIGSKPAPANPAVGTTVTFTTKVPGAPSQGTVVSIDAKTGKAVIAAEGKNWTGATITGAVVSETPQDNVIPLEEVKRKVVVDKAYEDFDEFMTILEELEDSGDLTGPEMDDYADRASRNVIKTALELKSDLEGREKTVRMPARLRVFDQGLTELPPEHVTAALTETTPEAEAIADALAAPDPAAAIEEAGMEQQLAAAAEAAVPGLVTGWTETQRDASKSEQMTPDEYGARQAEPDVANHGLFKSLKEAKDYLARRVETITKGQQMRELLEKYNITPSRAYQLAKASSGKWGVGKTHEHEIAFATMKNSSVSAEAVDTYGIKLPDGYVKQGELYVHQSAKLTPDEILAIAEPAIAADPLVNAATVNGTPGVEAAPVVAPQAGIELMTPEEFQDMRRGEAYREALAEWEEGPFVTVEGLLAEGGSTLIFETTKDRKPVGQISSFIRRGERQTYGISQYAVSANQPTNHQTHGLMGTKHGELRLSGGKKLLMEDVKKAVEWINNSDKPQPDSDYYDTEGAMDEHQDALDKAIAEKRPISAAAYDEYDFYIKPQGHKDGKLPDGYVRQGDRLVPPTDPTPRLQQSLDAVRAKVGAPKQVFSEANSPVTKVLDVAGFDKGITHFLTSIAQAGKPEHRALAKLLLRFPEMLAAVDVVKTHAPDAGFSGVWVPKTGQVLVNTAVQGPRGAVDTVLHEMLHAATAHSIDHPTPAQAAVLKRIESIRRNVLKRAQKSGDRSLIYGLSDTHEFISHFLTDPAFQRQIGAMTPKGERNWVEVIVQAIRDLLNGRARTQAEQVSQQIFSDLIAFTQDAAAGRYGQSTSERLMLLPEGPVRDNARFRQLTADIDPTPEGIEAWKAANPGAYAELQMLKEAAMKELYAAAIKSIPKESWGEVSGKRVWNSEGGFGIPGGLYVEDMLPIEKLEETEGAVRRENNGTWDDFQNQFDLSEAGFLTVSGEFEDGTYKIYDGHHRLRVIRENDLAKEVGVLRMIAEYDGTPWAEEPLNLRDDGTLIPPSEWADAGSDDIRFLPEGDSADIETQIARAKPLWKRLSHLLGITDPYNVAISSYPDLNTDSEIFSNEYSGPQVNELFKSASFSAEEKIQYNRAMVLMNNLRNFPFTGKGARTLEDERSRIFKMAQQIKAMPLSELTEDTVEELTAEAELNNYNRDIGDVADAAKQEASTLMKVLESFGQPIFTNKGKWLERGDVQLQPEAPDLSTPDAIRDTVAGFTPDGVTLDLDYQQLAEDVVGLSPINQENLIHSMVNRELAHQAGLAALGDTDDAQRYADILARSVTGNTTASDIMFHRGNPDALERLVRYLTGALKAMVERVKLRFDPRSAVYVDRLSRELAKAKDGYRVRSGLKPFDPDEPRFMFAGEQDTTARFNELTKDLDPQDIEGWKASHPEELKELTAMRERVLREMGYDVEGWHATDSEPFSIFIPKFAPGWGRGIYFADNPEATDEFGGRKIHAYVRIEKPFRGLFGGMEKDIEATKTYQNARDTYMKQRWGQDWKSWVTDDVDTFDFFKAIEEDGGFANALIRELGYDGIVTDASNGIAGKEIVAFSPSQVKSADPLALDASGKLITPDQWGDTGNSDIRFLPPADPETRYTRAHVGNKVLSARPGDELTPQGFTGWWRRMFGQKDDLHRMMSEDKTADEQLKRATQKDLEKLQKDLFTALGDIETEVVIDRISMALGDTSPLLTEEEENRIEAEMQTRIADARAIASPLIEDAARVRDAANAAARKAYKTALRSEDLKVRDKALGILNAAKAEAATAYDETVQVANDRTAEALNEAAEWERNEKIDSEIERATEMRRVRDLAQESLDKEFPAIGAWTTRFRRKINDLQEQVRDIYGDKPDLQAKIDRSLGIYLVRSYRIHQDRTLAEKVLHSPDYQESRDALIGFFEKQLTADEVERMRKGGKFEGMSDTEMLDAAPEERVAREVRKLKRQDAYKGVDDSDLEEIARGNVAEQAQIMFEDFILGHEGGSVIGGSTTDIRTDFTRFMRKSNLPQEIKDALQENRDPVYNAERTLSALAGILHSQRLLRSLTRSGVASGLFIDEATKKGNTKYRHWKPVVSADAHSRAFAPLAGWYASPEDVEAFRAAFHVGGRNAENTAEKASSKFNRFMLGMAGRALGVVTLGNPGYYIRNPFGGMIALAAQGSNPFSGDTLEGFKAVTNIAFGKTSKNPQIDEDMLEAVALGVLDNGTQIGYLRELLSRYDENPLGVMDWMQEQISKASESGGEAIAVARKAGEISLDWLGNLAQITEEFAMYAQWKKEIKLLTRASWGTAQEIKQEAARRAKMVMFAKSESSQAVKTFSTSPYSALLAPFARFKSELWRTFVNTYRLGLEDIRSGNPVLKAAGIHRIGSAVSVHAGLTVMLPLILQGLAGIGPDEDKAIRAAMPSYAKNTSFFFWRYGGNLYSGDLTYLNPFSFNMDPLTSAIRAVHAGDYGELPTVLTRVITDEVFGENVIAGKLMDIKRNKDESTSLPIYLDTDDWSTRTSKMIAHVGASYIPPIAKNANRAWEAFDRPHKDDEPWYFSPEGIFLSQFVPTKPRLINPEDMAYRAFRELSIANGQLWQITAPMKSPAGFNPNDVEDTYDALQNANRKVLTDAYRIAKGFKSLGVPNNKLFRRMTEAGFSQEKTALIFTGRGQRKVVDAESLKKMADQNPDLVTRWLARQQEHAVYFDITGK